MPADPRDPVPPRGAPAPLPGPGWDDQERILAEEMAAFPAEDEPDWAALEDLEYFGDGDAGDEGPWPADLPGPVAADHPGPGPVEHAAGPVEHAAGPGAPVAPSTAPGASGAGPDAGGTSGPA